MKLTPKIWHRLSVGVLALAATSAWAQDGTLTIDEALRIARERNGDVQAAFLSLEAAEENVRAARANFLPTITANVRREDGYARTYTGPGANGGGFNSTSSSVSLNYLLFDNGSRDINFRRSTIQEEITFFNTRQTLRSTLFNVHSRFYEALRAQELLRVRALQLSRFEELLKRTEAGVDVGETAAKDILQARADLLNSRASQLSAENAVSTAEANLKAVIGWPERTLPELEASTDPEMRPVDVTLDELVAQALERRPDLEAARLRVENALVSVRSAKLDTGLQYNLSAQYTRSFSQSVADRPSLVLQASYPVYDGQLRRANIQSAEFALESQRASLAQAELDIVAEVESAYLSYTQNGLILEAAQLAIVAARENYNAAQDAQRLGAAELIEVLTAQVTLVTAETNLVQALYDLLISEVRLDLATGAILPGEAGPELDE